jgi:hypothetical protein
MTPEADRSINPLGLELGARAGLDWRNIYLGGRFDHGFGSSTPDVSISGWVVGGEGGYGFVLGDITLRPMIGVGGVVPYYAYAAFTSAHDAEVYVEPSVTVLAPFGTRFFAGLDASVMLELPRGIDACPVSGCSGPTSTPWGKSFSVHLQIGVRVPPRP